MVGLKFIASLYKGKGLDRDTETILELCNHKPRNNRNQVEEAKKDSSPEPSEGAQPR